MPIKIILIYSLTCSILSINISSMLYIVCCFFFDWWCQQFPICSTLSAVSSVLFIVADSFTLHIIRSFLYVLNCLRLALCALLSADSFLFYMVSFLYIIFIFLIYCCLINSSNQWCKRHLTPLISKPFQNVGIRSKFKHCI